MKEFLEELTNTKRRIPVWIRIKAKNLLENTSQVSKEEILELSFEYFKVNDKIFKPKFRNDYKHMIRFAMVQFGFHPEEIAEVTNTDRTTIYHSIDFVNNVSSVDKGFKETFDKYLDFLKKH